MPDPDTFQSGLISASVTSSPARRSSTVRVLPAMPPPTTSTLLIGGPLPYLTAIGFTGEPTAPVIGSGAAVSQNS